MYTAPDLLSKRPVNYHQYPLEEIMIDQSLMNYFKFDDTDLQANRDGRFSEKQKNRLSKSQQDWKKGNLNWGLVLVALGVGIPAAILILSWVFSSAGDAQPHLDLGSIITAGVFFVLFGGLGLLLLLAGLHTEPDVSGDRVEKIEGPISLNAFAVNNSELHVGRKTFEIDETGMEPDDRLANLVIQGKAYAFYYDESDDRILSAELISKAK